MPSYKKLVREGNIYTVEFTADDGRTATKRFKGSEEEIDKVLEEATLHFNVASRVGKEELNSQPVTVKNDKK